MSNVASVSMQDEHAIIVTKDGKIYGWGMNTYNQISTYNTNLFFHQSCLLLLYEANYTFIFSRLEVKFRASDCPPTPIFLLDVKL